MNTKLVDLHIHSYFSDGTMSPIEIIEEAEKNNVGILAITDHNVLSSSKELIKINKSLICISGVELDALENDINFHILAYGIDLKNSIFNTFVEKNRELLEEVNIKLIKKMEKIKEDISLQEYLNFDYNKRNGGWKALHYFKEKKLTKNLNDGIYEYIKHNHSYSCVAFPSIKEVCCQIHNAGGKAILAHPGRVIKKSDLDFKNEIMKILDYGIDGIECYYPSHTDTETKICIDICNEKKLLITSGSDSHGEFEDTNIGQMNIKLEKLNLGDLIKNY